MLTSNRSALSNAAGKPEKGMPIWQTVLSDDALWQIFTFLETVQTPP